MTIRRVSHLSLMLLTALLFAVGCSDSSDPLGSSQDIAGENSMTELDLNKAYGGLSYTDEAEAFGDDALLAEATLEDDIARTEDDETDLTEDDPGLADPQVVRTFLRVMWGQLDGRPTTDAARDENVTRVVWDGNLTVSEGAIALKKTILFERPGDHRLPRDDRQVVPWASVTGPHVDGVLVCVLSRPDADGNLLGEITFNTEPLTQTYSIADLDGLEETIVVDENGNAVSFVGFTDRPGRCASGFAGGYWQKANSDDFDGGWFRGRVTTANGRLAGYLMGRFGLNDQGERVFAGKYIGRQGHIRGLLSGVYEPSGEGDGLGSFLGRWHTRNGAHVGTIKGRYETMPDRGAGFFHAVWEEVCE